MREHAININIIATSLIFISYFRLLVQRFYHILTFFSSSVPQYNFPSNIFKNSNSFRFFIGYQGLWCLFNCCCMYCVCLAIYMAVCILIFPFSRCCFLFKSEQNNYTLYFLGTKLSMGLL